MPIGDELRQLTAAKRAATLNGLIVSVLDKHLSDRMYAAAQERGEGRLVIYAEDFATALNTPLSLSSVRAVAVAMEQTWAPAMRAERVDVNVTHNREGFPESFEIIWDAHAPTLDGSILGAMMALP